PERVGDVDQLTAVCESRSRGRDSAFNRNGEERFSNAHQLEISLRSKHGRGSGQGSSLQCGRARKSCISPTEAKPSVEDAPVFWDRLDQERAQAREQQKREQERHERGLARVGAREEIAALRAELATLRTEHESARSVTRSQI